MFFNVPKKLVAGVFLALVAISPTASAEPVTLNSLDGSVSMTGELLSYDGESYSLGMQMGEITLDASQVTCEGVACPDLAAGLKSFSISGSEGIANGLLPSLVEEFALERGGDTKVIPSPDGSREYKVLEADGTVYASIFVRVGESTGGFAALLNGSSVISLTARPISAREQTDFAQAGKAAIAAGGQSRVLALDGLVAAVNPDNPVRILSLEQLASIFDGSITNWNQLGGNDAPITLYRADETADTETFFAMAAMAPLSRSYSPAATVLASDKEVSDAVAADRNGIGLTTYAQLRNARAVTLRSVCGELFHPSEFSIKSEGYPLTQRLYATAATTGMPDIAQAFFDFITSPSAQSVIRKAGYADQSLSRSDLDAQGRRLAQAIISSSGRTELLQLQDLASILLDAERLSFTLYFDENGVPDARALADINRLAARISTGEFTSRQMLVLAFSDNSGAINAQLVHTQAVAQDIRDRIVAATGRVKLGNLRISPIGYGRLMPARCNSSPLDQQKNNRVEFWIK